MKKYTHIILFSVLAYSFISCNPNKKENTNNLVTTERNNQLGYSMNNSQQQVESNYQNQEKNKPQQKKKLKYFNEVDQSTGMIVERFPFPASWQKHSSGEFEYTGPNNIKVYGQKGANYAYSNNPTYVQQYRMLKKDVKYPLSAEQTIQEVLVSYANTLNRKMTKKYPLKQIEDFDRMFDGLLYKIGQYPKQFEAMGIEWVDPDGTQWLSVFHYQLEQANGNVFWGFQVSAIGAPAAYFEQAKIDYLNGLINRQLNTDWIMKMNQQNEYAQRKSNEAHAKRLAQSKATFEKRQQEWKERQKDASLKNEQYTDFLTDRVNVIDPNTGTKSKIDNTSNHYWINTEGEYIGTEKYYDDPNKNAFMNNTTWRKLKIDDYK